MESNSCLGTHNYYAVTVIKIRNKGRTKDGRFYYWHSPLVLQQIGQKSLAAVATSGKEETKEGAIY